MITTISTEGPVGQVPALQMLPKQLKWRQIVVLTPNALENPSDVQLRDRGDGFCFVAHKYPYNFYIVKNK